MVIIYPNRNKGNGERYVFCAGGTENMQSMSYHSHVLCALCALCEVGCEATYSTQCTQLGSRLSNITTVTKEQKTIGSDNAVWPPDDGRKDARNMLRNYWLPIKSLIVASSWSHLYSPLNIFSTLGVLWYWQYKLPNTVRRKQILLLNNKTHSIDAIYKQYEVLTASLNKPQSNQ